VEALRFAIASYFLLLAFAEPIISVGFIQFVSCMFRLLHHLSVFSHLVVQAAFACPSLASQRSSQYRENFNSTIPNFNGICNLPIPQLLRSGRTKTAARQLQRGSQWFSNRLHQGRCRQEPVATHQSSHNCRRHMCGTRSSWSRCS
jgi:hypothetical protein